MKAFATTTILSATYALEIKELKYMQHLAKFGKTIESVEEYGTRLMYFSTTDELIEEHNAGSHNYTLGHNQFSDWSKAEYESILGHLPKPNETTAKNYTTFDESNNHMEVDWRAAGAVTPVKDQGYCGSCWVFSATGALEGKHFIESGELLSFSEQQVLECNGNYGCNGGLIGVAFYYWSKTSAATEEDYPYGHVSTECGYEDWMSTGVYSSLLPNVRADDVNALKAALQKQPVSVTLNASTSFHSYRSGVYDDEDCSTYTNHAVLAVGWGKDSATGLDYWLVKNSWNATWGDDGYIKIAIVDGKGICGIQTWP